MDNHKKFKKVKWLFGKTIDIPEEWEVTNLSDICSLRNMNGVESHLYVGLEHIGQNTNQLIECGDVKEFTSNKNSFYKHDVLYGKLRPILNKVWLATEDGYCSTDILPLQVKSNKIIPQTLLYILSTYRFFWYAVATSAGTKMPRTKWNDMKKFLVLCPPLPEQTRIASILSRVDATVLYFVCSRSCKSRMILIHISIILCYEYRFAEEDIHRNYNKGHR